MKIWPNKRMNLWYFFSLFPFSHKVYDMTIKSDIRDCNVLSIQGFQLNRVLFDNIVLIYSVTKKVKNLDELKKFLALKNQVQNFFLQVSKLKQKNSFNPRNKLVRFVLHHLYLQQVCWIDMELNFFNFATCISFLFDKLHIIFEKTILWSTL